MSKAKRMFEKLSAIAVIVYFSYFLFFINVEKEIISLFRECWMFFWTIVNGSPTSILLFSFLALIITISLINWILDDTKKRNKKIEKQEEKEKEKIIFGQSKS